MTHRLSPLALLSLALLGVVLAVAPLAAGAALGLRRLDLVHAAVFNACAMRSYDLHWQHPQRLPQNLTYDFVKSPDSFVLIEVWVQNGPTLSFSHRLPHSCQ
jgi:hypothetical protein